MKERYGGQMEKHVQERVLLLFVEVTFQLKAERYRPDMKRAREKFQAKGTGCAKSLR
jgi:hypothetical protein